jgi:hypothetical protein
MVFVCCILLVVFYQARYRGKLTHCRNNLLFLGVSAYTYMSSGDIPQGRGRGFWQDLREEFERGPDGSYILRNPDPYICPVLGKTVTDYSDPGAIDYRGPSRNPAQYSRWDPFGADRKGNHGEGWDRCHVLFVDLHAMTKSEVSRSIQPDPHEYIWEKVEQMTSD